MEIAGQLKAARRLAIDGPLDDGDEAVGEIRPRVAKVAPDAAAHARSRGRSISVPSTGKRPVTR